MVTNMEIFKDLTDADLIENAKETYNKEIDYIGMDDLSIFSWKNKHLKLTMLKVFWDNGNDNMAMFMYAEISDKDDFIYSDITDRTHNIQFETSNNNLERFAYIKRNIIKDAKPIFSSLFTHTGSSYSLHSSYTEDGSNILAEMAPYYWGKEFAKNEYLKASKNLSKNLLDDSLDLVNNKYYTDRFHFNEILNDINSEQFTLELNDCLKAYEHGFWFVCAAGLGGVIEHLLYISLQRLDDHYRESHSDDECKRNSPLKGLRNDPMKTDYIKKLKQFHPSFDSRTENHINSVFLLRNSIDHYNSGYSNKSICDLMLQGVADIYGNIYINS